MRIFKFDVMLGERFVHTFKIDVNTPYPPTDEEMKEYAIKKLPTLKDKDFKVYVYSNDNK